MSRLRSLASLSAAAAAGVWLRRRGQRTAGPRSPVPGRPKRWDTRLLEAGAALLQDRAPVRALNVYLNGFHFHADDLGRQIEAHHYCAALDEDLIQCVIFDGNRPGARLIGVEYVISERLFRTLPEEERRLWHSHHYEVASGTLAAPGIPEAAEHALMRKLAGTYGKTWHTWSDPADPLPLGIPSLMMGFTRDGQLDPRLVRNRDRRFAIDTGRRRARRRDLAIPRPLPGANAWEGGETCQLELAARPGPVGRPREAEGDTGTNARR